MRGSGLSECLEMIYGANAVKHILTGNAIARALREHFIVSKLISDLIPLTSNIQSGEVDAENQILLEATAISEDTAISKEDINDIKKLYNDFVAEINVEEDVLKSVALEKVNTTIQIYKDELAAKSRTTKL